MPRFIEAAVRLGAQAFVGNAGLRPKSILASAYLTSGDGDAAENTRSNVARSAADRSETAT